MIDIITGIVLLVNSVSIVCLGFSVRKLYCSSLKGLSLLQARVALNEVTLNTATRELTGLTSNVKSLSEILLAVALKNAQEEAMREIENQAE